MKNDESTYSDVGITSSVMCPVWSYSNDYNYIPNIKNGSKVDEIPKTTIFQNKITISTEEKTKTEKGGN